MKILTIILLISIGYSSIYEIGDVISNEHQQTTYPICYGDDEQLNLRLADFNGDVNGGDYKIIWIEMGATW